MILTCFLERFRSFRSVRILFYLVAFLAFILTEHRNMPMQDAMMLVAHNYDTYKIENREKEREEIARKAAKMADDVLLREPDRESHPVSLLTSITLLAENR